MTTFNLLKSMIFSDNHNLRNLKFRLTPLFYQRLIIDLIIRIFIFSPFVIGASIYWYGSGAISHLSQTLLENNQKLSGYINVIFLIVLTIILTVSLFYCIIGSVIKLFQQYNASQDDTDIENDNETHIEINNKTSIDLEQDDLMESNQLSIQPPVKFNDQFFTVTKNLWFVSFETAIIISLFYLSITYYTTHTFNFYVLIQYFVRSFFVTGISSAILSLIVSTPYQHIYSIIFNPKDELETD